MNSINSPVFGLIVGVGSLALVSLMFLAAYRDQFLFVWQMKVKGFKRGLPIIAHGGILNDIPFSIVLGLIVWKYFPQWSWQHCGIAIVIGMCISKFMHHLYVESGIDAPEALAYRGHLPVAGELHELFFTYGMAILILFFFFTPHIDPTFLKYIAVFVGFHIFMGNHMVLGMIRPSWMAKNYLTDKGAWATIIIVWVSLATRCWFILNKA